MSLSLDSSLISDELVIQWKRNVDETGSYEIKEEQNFDKKTEAAFQLGSCSFYAGSDL